MRVAISTMTWRRGSRPVISKSIHASTVRHYLMNDASRRDVAFALWKFSQNDSIPTPSCPTTRMRATRAATSWRSNLARCERAAGGRSWRPGIAVAIPEGHGGFVLPRSGLASRHGVTLANAPGLIDAGYRGEVKVALVNLDPEHDYQVVKRATASPSWSCMAVDLVDRSSSSMSFARPTRGEGGFGSSGR